VTRLLLTIVIPLILPSLGYLLWVGARSRAWPRGGAAALPWPWLIGGGVLLTALTLFAVSTHYGSAPSGTYVPPRIIDGRVVPGKVIPEATR